MKSQTKIKLCGMTRACDIEAANALLPDYIGFVFAPKSSRYVTPKKAVLLRQLLNPGITAVGVFVNEKPEQIAALLQDGIIDMAQLHGQETADYINNLRYLTKNPLIQAFRIDTARDLADAQKSPADYILLDSGGGTGTAFDWNLIQSLKRPCFLAGGLDSQNVAQAIKKVRPYAVDVSSGIETDGLKSREKMQDFVRTVRALQTT